MPELGALYVRYSACLNQEANPIDKFWQEVLAELDAHPTDRLIIDMRANGGGNGIFFEPMAKGLAQRPRLLQPGSIFAIADRGTYSAALYACGKLEALGAVFVGEPTGGRPSSIGEFVPFTLPFSGIMASASNRYHQNASSSDLRPYFAPRLVAEMTFADWSTNKDVAMDIIREYCRQNPR